MGQSDIFCKVGFLFSNFIVVFSSLQVNNNPNTGAVRFGGMTRTNGSGLQFHGGGNQLHSGGNQLHSGGNQLHSGAVQLHHGGELKITKSSNFEKPIMPSFSKTISSMKVPSGYEV